VPIEWPDKIFSRASVDAKSPVTIVTVKDLPGAPGSRPPQRALPGAELYREIYHKLSFEGEVQDDVKVTAYTPTTGE
jgi:hypothetical protein